jgi:hypothetical protein
MAYSLGWAKLFHLVGSSGYINTYDSLNTKIYICFFSMTKVYASEQKDDHQNYKSIYEANAEEFAMMERNSQYVT